MHFAAHAATFNREIILLQGTVVSISVILFAGILVHVAAACSEVAIWAERLSVEELVLLRRWRLLIVMVKHRIIWSERLWIGIESWRRLRKGIWLKWLWCIRMEAWNKRLDVGDFRSTTLNWLLGWNENWSTWCVEFQIALLRDMPFWWYKRLCISYLTWHEWHSARRKLATTTLSWLKCLHLWIETTLCWNRAIATLILASSRTRSKFLILWRPICHRHLHLAHLCFLVEFVVIIFISIFSIIVIFEVPLQFWVCLIVHLGFTGSKVVAPCVLVEVLIRQIIVHDE